jgi:hypothetical protein
MRPTIVPLVLGCVARFSVPTTAPIICGVRSTPRRAAQGPAITPAIGSAWSRREGSGELAFGIPMTTPNPAGSLIAPALNLVRSKEGDLSCGNSCSVR